MKQESQGLYQTSDLNLATTLFAYGHTLIGLKPGGDHRYCFCFYETPELSSRIQAFWDRELSVEPQSLFDCQRALKARIHNSSR